MNTIITFISQTAIIILLITALWGLGIVKIKLRPLVYFSILFFIDFLCLHVFSQYLNGFIHYQLNWNWVGKILSVIILAVSALALIKINNEYKLSNMGLTFRQNSGSTLPSLIVLVALVVILHIGDSFTSQKLDIETLLYQASMPGLAEEAGYRGVLLFLLSCAVVSREIKLFSAPINVACILITILFGLVHGISYDGNTFHVYYQSILIVGVVGFCLLWVRQRTGSILLPIIFHNVFNVANQFFQ